MKHTTKIFKALSDPTRLRMLLLLLQRDLCVCELTAILDMEQSRISHQLRVLRNAELIEDIRDGRWIIYRVTEDKKKEIRLIFDHLIRDALANSGEIIQDQGSLETLPKSGLRNRPFLSKGEMTR